jgi:peptide-methionine (S)-S-oxide reductase
MIKYLFSTILLVAMFAQVSCSQAPKNKSIQQSAKDQKIENMEGLEKATLGAGCFWCVEAIFQDLAGVKKVESGYAGGHVKNPTYKEVCSGRTGHAEVIQITFDPKVISYEDILEVFWYTHDPTTLNRQGADVGTQYRSAIFYHSEAQKAIAEKSKKAADASGDFQNPIVTEIVEISNYYEAEDYHQDYYNNNGSSNGYCRVVITPKIQKFRKKYSDKLKEEVKEQ